MPHLHSTKRRPEPLKDTDYDHEINLVDHTKRKSPARSPTPSATERPPSAAPSDSSSRRHSDVPLRKHPTSRHLRKELTRRKYSKYQDRQFGARSDHENHETPEGDNSAADYGEQVTDGEEERGRSAESGTSQRLKNKVPETAIDVLYENQRGGFLCGMPLFSAKALGSLDPSPWSNIALKASATDITNAQPPDPSWEWASKEWTVNHSEDVDDDGWEYSFAFSKKFSWHGPKWWNSFVRRRAWVRKRIKRHIGYQSNEAHMLNGDYFTIHSAQLRSRSRASTHEGSIQNRYSTISLTRQELDEEVAIEDICDIGSLMKALRRARIDREKTEAVQSFIQFGGEDLYYLRDHMHEIMRIFIFQASRRLLLSHLLQIFNDVSSQQAGKCEHEIEPDRKRRLENLKAAVKHADEEVRKLEFWSDVKDMAEKGETLGAVDANKGWDTRWVGLDDSGPKDVISSQTLPGTDNCKEGEGNGTALSIGKENEKGKDEIKE